MPRKKMAFNFEKALKELEILTHQMEQGEASLEKSLKNFTQGISLIKECQKALTQAEQAVYILSQEKNETKLQPFPTEQKENNQ